MKGFTLVEMLVALMIFGILAATGVVVMRSTLENQAGVRREVDRLAAFQRLRATLKADLGQAADRRTRGPDGAPAGAAFLGGEATGGAPMLALVRRGWENPDHRPRPSLQYVEYRLTDSRLQRQVRTALDGVPAGEPQVMIEGVEGAELAFYARRQWAPVWMGPGLPEVVRLDLRLKGLGSVSQLFLTPGASP
jgi:general secretion pathway protein J